MLTYDLNDKNGKPCYIYLYERIKNDIEKGLLKENFKLPSKRSLAERLKISVLTVQNAYFLLQNEGYIYTKERSGYFVSEIQRIETKINKKPADKAITKQEYFMDFCENSTNTEHFPFTVWAKIFRKELTNNPDLLRRPPNVGVYKLRKALSDYLYRSRGMAITPNQIVIGAGTEYLYSLIIKILGKDKVYALEDPCYQKMAQIYFAENVKTKFIPLEVSGIDIEKLNLSETDVVHVSPSHHFPTGIVMPAKRRYELLIWANAKTDRYIIEDDYDSEFRYNGKVIPTLMSIDNNERVIFINTFSKTISPGIRISYMVLPEHLMAKFNKLYGFYSCTVSSIEQYALATFVEEGYFERHINRMKKIYKQKRDIIINAINNSPLKDFCEILEEEAGLHFLLKLKTDISDTELIKLAEDRGLKISCMSNHANDKLNVEKNLLIINYSGIEVNNISKAIEVILNICKKNSR